MDRSFDDLQNKSGSIFAKFCDYINAVHDLCMADKLQITSKFVVLWVLQNSTRWLHVCLKGYTANINISIATAHFICNDNNTL